ncbi:MAG: sce7725 family protein [Chitinophagales bacterium]|nr:sce7725 family protein [Chitinophagales bacterium]
MYFSYLRCKQFELLALKEIAPRLDNASLISPILEPVKVSTSAFERAVESLVGREMNFTIIVNPLHGEFVEDNNGIFEMINNKLQTYDNFQIGILLHGRVQLPQITASLQLLASPRGLTLVHIDRVNDLEELAVWGLDKDIRYNLYGENFPVRRYRDIIAADTKVLLEDKFKPQVKNANYLNVPDEFFSDDYLYYEQDGFIGFGDYLTIGDDFTTTGRLPYAIAIHLTYVRENGEIWIRHFVSDSNTDTTDVAGKFGEALEKLIAFINERNIQTYAANEFRTLHENGHYPGLGSLKKLSVMHHLELVHDLLNA